MHGDERADLARHFGTGFGCGLHGTDVAVDDDCDKAITHLLAADDGHVGGLHHGICGGHGGDVALGLDHSDCVAGHVILLQDWVLLLRGAVIDGTDDQLVDGG